MHKDIPLRPKINFIENINKISINSNDYDYYDYTWNVNFWNILFKKD